MSATVKLKRPSTLMDHADCYRDLRHVERERDDLRREVAELRAQLLELEASVEQRAVELAVEAQEVGW